jgi:hypothetical protein
MPLDHHNLADCNRPEVRSYKNYNRHKNNLWKRSPKVATKPPVLESNQNSYNARVLGYLKKRPRQGKTPNGNNHAVQISIPIRHQEPINPPHYSNYQCVMTRPFTNRLSKKPSLVATVAYHRPTCHFLDNYRTK